MADSKLSALAALTGALSADDDEFLVVDTSASESKRITLAELVVAINAISGDSRSGSGTPEGSETASVGATFHRTDGGAGTSFYVKESGAGNTGWVAK